MSSARSLRSEDQDQEGIFKDWCGVEVGIEGVGGKGPQSLFLFQLDRIGTLAQGEETQKILSCDCKRRYH